jgi:tRNA modification GTPase
MNYVVIQGKNISHRAGTIETVWLNRSRIGHQLARPGKLRPSCTRRDASSNASIHQDGLAGTARAAGSTTIYALSTAPGRAAIAIIRISGPACLDIYAGLCPGKAWPKPRQASVRPLHEPGTLHGPDNILDASALILYFPAPQSVTGEDVLELHVHGGIATVQAVLAAIPKAAPPGSRSIRYAEPGEFTRRAFLNDRLDLTQVEALGDTLSATTEQQRRLSVRGMTSGLPALYDKWRQQLLYARGELEALIDFSEDQHFDESSAELCTSVAHQIVQLRNLLQVYRQNAVRGETLRNGITLSLLGAPNVGKSSLLNCVIGREAAIVSHEAGTTRDVVEIGVDIGGYLCRLGDTAGLRSTVRGPKAHGAESPAIGAVEQEGIRRARARAAASDVVIAVFSFETVADEVKLALDEEVLSTVADLMATKGDVLVVVNKIDQASEDTLDNAVRSLVGALPGLDRTQIFPISCKAAEATVRQSNSSIGGTDPGNIQAFVQGLILHFKKLTAAVSPNSVAADSADPSIWQESLGASERHRLLLEECVGYLDAFLAEVAQSGANSRIDQSAVGEADIVLAAEHLRGAAGCLARITGRGDAGDVEEVLGVVFEKFCVGK